MLQTSIGVLNQTLWPTPGDIDDCTILSDLQCLHATAPWLTLTTITTWRAAAGNPDDQAAPDGLTIPQSVAALAKLAPLLKVESSAGAWSWATFAGKLKAAERIASVAVMAGSLPDHGTFLGRHRVSVWWDGAAATFWILNPLKKAHSRATKISAADLQAAVLAYGATVHAIVYPTPADAFRTHPLLAPAIAAATADTAARLARVKSKVAANAADVADD